MKQAKKIFTRMCLNNWGGINHKILEFHEYVNLFSGKSGSGKSTVMDAIQVVLYGSFSPSFLNKAADDAKNRRSVLSYLRGEQKDGTANREGQDFCSQIVLELQDTGTKQYVCMGIAFEVRKNDSEIRKFVYFSHLGKMPEGGYLTEEGAAFLDETGNLESGIMMCPPEGDAGTGMTATNSVAPRTGNVSAGTSTFAMIVLEKQLSKVYREIDMVTTPTGFPCAMSHANNGTSDLNAWIGIFGEFAKLMGMEASSGDLFQKLYTKSLEGDLDCGGLLAYGYYSGENITMLNEGRLAFLRTAESKFNLANFMKVNLYTSLGAVKMGLDILMDDEKVKVEKIMGHGGFFKTKGVGQRYLAAAVGAPVTVMDTASEGGAWGIALLAAYLADKKDGEKLEDFLDNRIFKELSGEMIEPAKEEIDGFDAFMDHYKAGLEIEKSAIEHMKW